MQAKQITPIQKVKRLMRIIQGYRKRYEISSKDMAKHCNMNVLKYSRCENGAAIPTPIEVDIIKRIITAKLNEEIEFIRKLEIE